MSESLEGRSANIVRASVATELGGSRLERVSRAGIVTVLCAMLELFEFAIVFAIGDLTMPAWKMAVSAIQSGHFGKFLEYTASEGVGVWLQDHQPYIDHGYSVSTLLIAVASVGFLLVAVELLVRHRSHRRGFTIPLVLIPLGRAVRFLIVLLVSLAVLVPKLLVYFLTLTIGLPIMASSPAAARLLDRFDVVFEPVERGVNRLYNLLYFNKIEASGSTFTALFNLPLTLWSLNH